MPAFPDDFPQISGLKWHAFPFSHLFHVPGAFFCSKIGAGKILRRMGSLIA
jgi:hypothetical protein